MTQDKTHYELLGVPRNVDSLLLRRAFRMLSKELHPDTTLLPKEEALKKFQQIREAYEVLADPNSRITYDNSLIDSSFDGDTFDDHSLIARKSIKRHSLVDVRRPFSGGELLSLLLLALAILLSLLLVVAFALANGRELEVLPSWLITFRIFTRTLN